MHRQSLSQCIHQCTGSLPPSLSDLCQLLLTLSLPFPLLLSRSRWVAAWKRSEDNPVNPDQRKSTSKNACSTNPLCIWTAASAFSLSFALSSTQLITAEGKMQINSVRERRVAPCHWLIGRKWLASEGNPFSHAMNSVTHTEVHVEREERERKERWDSEESGL